MIHPTDAGSPLVVGLLGLGLVLLPLLPGFARAEGAGLEPALREATAKSWHPSAALLALVLGLVVLPLIPGFAKADSAAAPLSAKDVEVDVLGTSTLHPWKASAASATVTAAVAEDSKGLLADLQAGDLKSLDLVVAAGSLHSPEGSGMDKNMHKSLEADKYPNITFHLTSYQVQGTTVTAQGSLSIHGQSQPVALTGSLSAVPGGVRLDGSAALQMTTYGVTPPVILFGTVKVGDEVKIQYHFTLPN